MTTHRRASLGRRGAMPPMIIVLFAVGVGIASGVVVARGSLDASSAAPFEENAAAPPIGDHGTADEADDSDDTDHTDHTDASVDSDQAEEEEPPDRSLPAIGGRLTPIPGVRAPATAAASRTGDPSLYVLERSGSVRILRDGALQPDSILDFSDDVVVEGEGGALGLAFSADGEFLYTSYTGTGGANVIDEYSVDPTGRVATASRRQVLRIPQPSEIHNGGHLAFGPDGLLYIGIGDGRPEPEPGTISPAQDLDTLLGKLLRIDPRAGDPYGIPADNPFAGDGEARGEIWALGLRNPWRFSFDSETGDLWIGDVGHGLREEINRRPAGAAGGDNYGWSLYEGSIPFRGYDGEPPDNYIAPVYEYARTAGERCAVIGGVVYRGEAFPALQGRYLYGDYCEGQLRMLDLDEEGNYIDAPLGPVDSARLMTALVEGPDAELFVLSLDGLFRLDAD